MAFIGLLDVLTEMGLLKMIVEFIGGYFAFGGEAIVFTLTLVAGTETEVVLEIF